MHTMDPSVKEELTKDGATYEYSKKDQMCENLSLLKTLV